jgi:energy-coupling factor transporter ATP-binding protein EcfA2
MLSSFIIPRDRRHNILDLLRITFEGANSTAQRKCMGDQVITGMVLYKGPLSEQIRERVFVFAAMSLILRSVRRQFSGEDTITARMRLGDLLIQARLVTVEQVTRALELQGRKGGRLGDHLVADGAIARQALDDFLHRMPAEPADMAATGIADVDLMRLLMKLIYTGHLESVRQFADAIKLPFQIVLELVQMAIDRHLLHTLGTRESESLLDMCYTFTEQGKRYTADALEQSRYTGPAPVTIEDFNAQVNLQKVTNEIVTFERIRKAFGNLTFEDRMIEQSGPALNSGRAMLLYGPPGNGKTSVAQCFASVFNDVIYVPYAVMVEGQIIRVHDPSFHNLPESELSVEEEEFSLIRREKSDARWVPCKRPFVLTGGELTLEMLDLKYDITAKFYEAPLHMKALGGCFVIDDFGRQLVSPTNLLNRWIVPLESRVDYLKLHTGKSFFIPFEELLIFSTNLVDPAFLRRLPYKIEVGAPTLENYRRIFENECRRQGLELPDGIFESIAHKLRVERGVELAGYQPRFIVDQVVATCRFMGEPPHFEPRFIEYAIANLHVRRNSPHKGVPAPGDNSGH